MRSFAVAVSLALALISAPSRAEPSDHAREMFRKGVEAFQKDDYAAALDWFRKAAESSSEPAITYNVARSLEKLGRPQEAVAAYEAYLAAAGENGEFTSASTLAIAQIKARSTRVRIESQPPGASVLLDGTRLAEKTPTSALVPSGTHVLELELDGWKEAKKFDAPGNGTALEFVFSRAEEPASEPKVDEKPTLHVLVPPRTRPTLDGLVGSFGLSLSIYKFVGTQEEGSGDDKKTAESKPGGLVFGLAFDVGWALASRTELVFRGSGGFGSSDGALATVGAGSLAVGHRITQKWWLGGGVAFGSGSASSPVLGVSGDHVTVATDLALGPALELGYVLDQNEDGHWLVELLPTALLSTSGAPSTFYVPLVAGYRWF